MICSFVKTVLPSTETSPKVWISPSLTGMVMRTRLPDGLDLRIAERDVLVAVVLVVVLDALEILVELRRDVEVLLADPGDEVVLLDLLHLAAQLPSEKRLLPTKSIGGDLGLHAFIDDEDDLLLARLAEVLGDGVDLHAFEAALGVRALDRFGGALDERLLDRAADVEVDLLALERLVDLRSGSAPCCRGTRPSRCAGAL